MNRYTNRPTIMILFTIMNSSVLTIVIRKFPLSLSPNCSDSDVMCFAVVVKSINLRKIFGQLADRILHENNRLPINDGSSQCMHLCRPHSIVDSCS